MTSGASAAAPAPNYSAWLDWIRFLAAFMVVLSHARIDHWVAWGELAAGERPAWAQLFLASIRFGPEAVIVFFALSGHLVGGKLLTEVREGRFSVRDYLIDRSTRLLPPWLAAIALTLACVWYVGGWPPGYERELLGNLLQLQGIWVQPLTGNAPLWSLGYEFWFYVLAGAFAVLLSGAPTSVAPRWGARIAALLALACLLQLHLAYTVCWFLGAAWARASKLGRASFWSLPVLALAAAGLCQLTNPAHGIVSWRSEWLHAGAVVLLGGTVARLLPALRDRSRTAPRPALAAKLAGFSYTLYLSHFPLLLVMREWHAPFPSFSAASFGLFAVKIALCLAAAWLLGRAVEGRTGALRRAWRRHWTDARTAPLPA